MKSLAKPIMLAAQAVGGLPAGADDFNELVKPTCNCHDHQSGATWCKHAAALARNTFLFCEADPFYPFSLFGMDIERLAQDIKEMESAAQKRGRVIVVVDSDGEELAPPAPAPAKRAKSSGTKAFPIDCS